MLAALGKARPLGIPLFSSLSLYLPLYWTLGQWQSQARIEQWIKQAATPLPLISRSRIGNSQRIKGEALAKGSSWWMGVTSDSSGSWDHPSLLLSSLSKTH